MKKILTIRLTTLLVVGLAISFTATSAQAKPMREILPLPGTVFDASGTEVPTESLRGKIVALYFSAHWCGPCKKFTPQLIKFHEANKRNGFEVVFMSLDRSQSQKDAYMKQSGMNWYTAPGHGTKEINFIMDYYKLRGIPALIVFGPNGEVITTDGRSDVTGNPGGAFAKWQAATR
ncbi:MAG: thioredoxin family protein [Verrucomicrobiales bacterium]|nr:thioredoxin family protein [Verrucomicrobiales bacterium]